METDYTAVTKTGQSVEAESIKVSETAKQVSSTDTARLPYSLTMVKGTLTGANHTMNKFLLLLAKFTFYFTTATYLLAVPVTYFTVGGDALLPYESAICILLSSAFYFESGKQVRSILK